MKNLFTTALLTKLRTIINTRNVKALSTTCLMVVFAIQFAWAAPLPSCSQLAISSSLGLSGINHAGNLATKFTVLPGKSIRVTELGVYDEAQDGMNAHDVPVRILKDDGMGGTIVVCTITFSGTAGTLASSSPFRMQSITPVVLGPGDYYVSAVFTNYNQYANSSTTTNGNPSYGTLDGYISFGANPCGYNGNSTLALPVNPDSYQYHAATFTAEPITNITTQPTGGNKGFGEAVSLTTAADGTAPMSYDWYSNTANSNIGGTPVGTTDTYMPLTSTVGSKYYYAIASAGCTSANGSDKDTSDVVQINVFPVKKTYNGELYATLQAAIDDPSFGDIVLLTDITEGQINIHRPVRIESNFSPYKTITSTSSAYGLYITAGDVSLQNFTITHPGIATAMNPTASGTFGILTDCVDDLVIWNISVNSFGNSGFAINGCDNGDFRNLTTTNNGGNGISLTNCTNSLIDGITTSGNAFPNGFSAGVGIFTSPTYCLPAVTSGLTFSNTNIAEPFGIYEQPGTGTISGTVLPTTDSFFVASGSASKFYGSLAECYSLAALFININANPPSGFGLANTIHVEDLNGNQYVKRDIPVPPLNTILQSMAIQSAIDNIASGKKIFAEGTGAFSGDLTIPAGKEVIIPNSFSINGDITISNGATLYNKAAIQPTAGKKLTNSGTLTGNGVYTGEVLNNNGTISPKQ
jgi:hypothetical protein